MNEIPKFQVSGDLPFGRDGHTCCVIGSKMYVYGGYEESHVRFGIDGKRFIFTVGLNSGPNLGQIWSYFINPSLSSYGFEGLSIYCMSTVLRNDKQFSQSQYNKSK